MPHVFKRAAARRDLVVHYVYLTENAGENGVSIVRVLYATQDWWQLFGVNGP
jgi:hypothetical protein